MALDDEAISNTLFTAFTFDVPFSNKGWVWNSKLIYAQLAQNPLVDNEVEKSLGFEINTGITYKPDDNLTWTTEIGYLAPGDAFKGGDLDLKNDSTMGMQTKVGISF